MQVVNVTSERELHTPIVVCFIICPFQSASIIFSLPSRCQRGSFYFHSEELHDS